jgi:hypothetical protein
VGAAALALGRLADLATGLRERGLVARLQHAPEPAVRVTNPAAGSLSETVSVALADDRWWFMWSWDERITALDDVDTAADRVVHVLTPMGTDG